ncbi:hypothetical protein [Hyphomicrobium denitrificans]|uniref:hypothetical protein n=1 Tax=Hyphomicrobium denitrificans TaxID=53399 RepID=UPI00022E242F|nr:hypothetical protein [Hyphomicrobium denitrificans]
MCDYSLEMYQSRPAREGEEYVSSRFPSSSVGFISPGDSAVAICMACDTKLKLSHIPEGVQAMANVGETEEATFVQGEGSLHRDCVRFKNGRVFTLQLLGPGVTAWLVPEIRCSSATPAHGTPETALNLMR